MISNKARTATLRWHWREGVKSSHDVCSYNRGIYSAIPTLWGYAPATVSEDPCSFQGGPYCEVSINWGVGVGKLRGLFERIFSRTQHLKDALDQVEKDKLELRNRFEELAAKKADLDQKVEILKALNVATRTLVSSPDTQRALAETLRPMIGVLGFDRAMIMEYREATAAPRVPLRHRRVVRQPRPAERLQHPPDQGRQPGRQGLQEAPARS